MHSLFILIHREAKGVKLLYHLFVVMVKVFVNMREALLV